jgi:hypothetical protein
MTGPFRPPALLLPAAPAAASASVMAAIGHPALPPSAAAVAASAAVDLNFSNAGDDSDDSGICEVVGPPLRPAGNKGKTPFICLTGDILRVMTIIHFTFSPFHFFSISLFLRHLAAILGLPLPKQ